MRLKKIKRDVKKITIFLQKKFKTMGSEHIIFTTPSQHHANPEGVTLLLRVRASSYPSLRSLRETKWCITQSTQSALSYWRDKVFWGQSLTTKIILDSTKTHDIIYYT